MTPRPDSEWPEGEPSGELAELIAWAWEHTPGLVIAWGITHKDSMLDAMRKEREKVTS
jgi:hypothetical protein